VEGRGRGVGDCGVVVVGGVGELDYFVGVDIGDLYWVSRGLIFSCCGGVGIGHGERGGWCLVGEKGTNRLVARPIHCRAIVVIVAVVVEHRFPRSMDFMELFWRRLDQNFRMGMGAGPANLNKSSTS
jgi:hypothetical protein